MSVNFYSRSEWFPHVVTLACVHSTIHNRMDAPGAVSTFLAGVHRWTDLNTATYNARYTAGYAAVRFSDDEVLNAWRSDLGARKATRVQETMRWLAGLNYNCGDGRVQPSAEDLAVLVHWYERLASRLFPDEPIV
mgnify:CR=1 FL=1